MSIGEKIMEKSTIIFVCVILVISFSSCEKCLECENDEYGYDGNDRPYYEVCSDNFEDRDAFDDYIDDLEDSLGFECQRDWF
jgi:hypothetical protein